MITGVLNRNKMEPNYIFILSGVIAAGFFWRWIDRIDKKIDNINEFVKEIATRSELERVRQEFKSDNKELWDALGKLVEKYNNCKNCHQ